MTTLTIKKKLSTLKYNMVNTTIITIGDELLIGQVIDTNSTWMAKELNEIGIAVTKRIAIGDRESGILEALAAEVGKAQIILITGGLGPTKDDITKEVLCKYFETVLEENEVALANIKWIFDQKFKRPLQEVNIQQAWLPKSCTPIQNKNGTAPGMLFKKNDSLIISMPGVPFEMKAMMTETILPLLKQKFIASAILHRTLLCVGIGESFLAAFIQDFENSLPTNINLAYLPSYGTIRLRLSGHGPDEKILQNEIDSLFTALTKKVAPYLVTAKDETMAEVIADILLKNKFSISTAESCTGGYIAHLLTEKAGASAYFEGSVVTYSYEAKEKILIVPPDMLLKEGAVSEPVVKEMAKNVREKFNTDFAIAVSGIMGPGGATPDKPIGTVWVAVAQKNKVQTKCFHFNLNRANNIHSTAIHALNFLRQFILANLKADNP